MSIEFRDSFNHWDAFNNQGFLASGGGKWTTSNGNPGQVTGRFGVAATAMSYGINNLWMEKVLTAVSTRIIQLGWKCDSFVNTPVICQHYDSTTKQVEYTVSSTGQILAKRGDGTTLATSAAVLTAGVWAYIETKTTIDNSAGACYVWVNGVSVISATGLDTQNSANATADRFRLAGIPTNTSGTTSFSDLVVLNTTGSAPWNDRLGEVRVECIYPNASGTTTDFALSTGSSHSAVVDDTPFNNADGDYSQSATVGHIELLNLGSLVSASGATILEVTVHARMKKTDATARGIAVGVKDTSSGTPSWGSTETLTTSYAYYSRSMEQNPVTASNWTDTEVNALEAGVKVIS